MNPSVSTFVFRVIVYLVAAWVAYIFDRQFGKSWYRKWYNMTHETELADDAVLGFVIGRGGKQQCRMALLLTIVITIIMAALYHDTALTWMVTGFFGLVVSIIGFVTGPFAANLWAKRDKVYDTVDDLSHGRIDAGKKIDEKFQEAKQEIQSRWSRLLCWFWGVWTDVVPTKSSALPPSQVIEPMEAEQNVSLSPEPAAVATQERELTAQEKMDRFTRGG